MEVHKTLAAHPQRARVIRDGMTQSEAREVMARRGQRTRVEQRTAESTVGSEATIGDARLVSAVREVNAAHAQYIEIENLSDDRKRKIERHLREVEAAVAQIRAQVVGTVPDLDEEFAGLLGGQS